MFENCKFLNQNFGGVNIGQCNFFYYVMDISGNKSFETYFTSSEKSF